MDGQKKNRFICALFALLFAAGFFLCAFFPKARHSDSERRALASLPNLSAESVWNGRFMSEFETYAADTFPFRDTFRKIQSAAAFHIFLRKDNHGIYKTEGFLSAMEYPFHETSLNRAAEKIRSICETYLTSENRVFLSVIPDKNCFLAKESGHLSMDYAEFEEKTARKAGFAEYIKISDLLERDDFYKTDAHWRQERITDVAERLAQTMGTDISKEYKIHTLQKDFYGAYYGQAALSAAPDKIQYLTNDAIDGCIVYDWENEKEIPVYNMERAMGRDPYEMFLSGSISLLTIENPDASSTKRLVMFRDSFGSGIAPLLIEAYSRIDLVDTRYIQSDFLERFIDFQSCDVLFLYSTLTLNHSETLK